MTKLNNSLQGNPVNNKILGANQDGYVLAWDQEDGYWGASPRPFNYNITPNYNTTIGAYDTFFLFSEKIYPLMNITIVPYMSNSFSGSIVFPAGIPFSATINTHNAGNISVYLSSNFGTNASILAPTDGYTNGLELPGRILIGGLQNITELYDGNNPGPGYNVDTGIESIFISNSTGFDGYVGGIPQAGTFSNNGLYSTYYYEYPGNTSLVASIADSTSINIYSQNQASLNSYIPYLLTSLNEYDTGIIFTNGSNIVGGALSTFLTDNVGPGIQIKSNNDSNTSFATITSVDSNSQITLSAPYSGTSTILFPFEYEATFGPNITFTTGSNIVTGSTFTSTVTAGQYVAQSGDVSLLSNFTEVLSVDSDTQLTLVSNYPGAGGGGALNILDTITFTNGSTAVTGTSNSSFFSLVSGGGAIKLSSDSNSDWAEIASVNSFDSITLVNPYNGTSASGVAIIHSAAYANTFDGYVSYPDTNNSHLTWATLSYNQANVTNINIYNSETECLISSDGNRLYTSSVFIEGQEFYQTQNVFINNGFNWENVTYNNLYNFELTANSVSSNFSFAIYPQNFTTTITNTTSYQCTFGISNDGSTFVGSTITVPAGALVAAFSDGITGVITFTSTSPSPTSNTYVQPGAPITSNNSPLVINPVVQLSGTTFYSGNFGAATITLPYCPGDGYQYTFKDDAYAWNNSTPFTVNSSTGLGIDFISQRNNQANAFGLQSSVIYTTPGLGFTLQYSLTTSGNQIQIGNSPSGESQFINAFDSPYNMNLSGPDYTGNTNYIDGTDGSVVINLPASPTDGTQYTFADQNFSWSNTNTVTLNTSDGSGIQINANSYTGGTSTYNLPNTSFTLRFSAGANLWQLVGVWRLISSTGPEVSSLTIFGGTSYTRIDCRYNDYLIDTTGGPVSVDLDDGITPINGDTISFKDIAQSWSSNNFSLSSINVPIELPIGIGGGPGNFVPAFTAINFATNSNYVKYVYSSSKDQWFLISQLLTETGTS